jgi:O-antigen ligase/Tfp pilus assembly protein PilF
VKRSSLMPWIGAVLFFLAVSSALYYHGFVADFFCITQFLLLLWLLSALWSRGQEPVPLPCTALGLSLVAYVGWLAVTLTWGTVPSYNVITFWWLCGLPLAFWLYTVSPEREALWHRVALLVLILALVLSLQASYQLVVRELEPKSVFLDINSHAAFIALIALPAAGYFIASLAVRSKHDGKTYILGAAVFILVFAIALTAGRGAMVVLVTGMAVLIGVAWGRAPRRAIVALTILVVAGLFMGNIVAQGKTTARMLTLIDPETAGLTRFLIWEQTWAIIKEAPWLGKGLGAFGLVFPAYQNPLDSSAGFMVHNDYLQIWLEAGLPGLVLLLAIYVSAFMLFIRTLRNRRLSKTRVIEIAGIFSGLLAVALHSFVNFDLYILPTSLVAGVMLARFHELTAAGSGAGIWAFKPTRYLRLGIYRAVVLLVVLTGVVYWLSHALANYAIQEAVHLVSAGELDQADDALSRAYQLSPDSEITLVARAELYRHVISAAPNSALEDKQRLFQSAMETLDRAERLNPYRADISFLRARLLWLVKNMAGEYWKEQMVRDYERAIQLQPRFFTARFELAAFWLEQGEHDKARVVLEQGMAYNYVGQERVLPYYRLTAALRRKAGDVSGARELEQRIADILSIPPEKRPLPLDQVKFFSFYDLWRWFLRLFGRV